MAGSLIIKGLRDFYYAVLNTDAAASIAYATPVNIPGAVKISIKTDSKQETMYADDGAFAVATANGKVSIDGEFAEITLADKAALSGADYSAGKIVYASANTPPYVALGFKSQLSGGGYRFTWLVKGKIQFSDEGAETSTDTAKLQSVKFTGEFINRTFVEAVGYLGAGKNLYKIQEDDAVAGTFFSSAYLEGAAIAALTCTAVPADSDSGVVVSSNMTWTYNNAIDPDFATNDYFTVTKADGTVVAGAVSIDATNKIVTFNPTSNLAGSSAVYIGMASNAVTDVHGQKVGANTVANWTTA